MKNKNSLTILLLLIFLLGSSGPIFARTVQKYEGESAALSATGAGTGTVSGTSVGTITSTSGSLTFTVNAPASMKAGQTCDVLVRFAFNATGSKTLTLRANGATAGGNGVSAGTVAASSTSLTSVTTQVNLKPGVNTIEVKTSAATAYIDYIEITFIDDVPVTPNSSKNAKKLYSFLLNNYQKKTISGSMENNIWDNNKNDWFENMEELQEVAYIKDKGGQYPVLLCGDFMHYTGWDADIDGNTWFKGHGETTVNLAIQIWEKGGIPAANWHWRNPLKTDPGKSEFYTDTNKGADGTTFALKNALNASATDWNTESPEYKAIIEDIDNLSNLLQKLKNLDVPLLWRPVHEPNGNFFWWGGTYKNASVAAYKKLYRLMYDRMVNVHGLTNLIWVWNLNYSGVTETIYNNYYPGDEYVDIVSWDTYQARTNYPTNYTNLKTWSKSGKIIAMAECGASPLPADMTGATKQYWSYFMPWYGDYTMGTGNSNTTAANWAAIMTHDYVFTLDKMPGWDWDIYEAEDAIITVTKENGVEGIITPLLKASGNAYLDMKDCNMQFEHVYADKAGTYDLRIRYSLPPNYDGENPIGARTQNLVVNGATTAIHFNRTTDANTFATIETTINLNAGDNIVALNNSWGWVNVDYIAVKTGSGLIPTPSKPRGLSKVSATKNSIEVSWTASTGGDGAISYHLYLNGAHTANTPDATYTFTGLDPDTEYTIEVEAEDAAGTKSEKAAITISTEPAIPGIPADLSKVFADKSSIAISWTASTGGNAPIGYNLYLNTAFVAKTTEVSYTFTGLNPETEYTIEVEAIDATEVKSSGKAAITISTEPATPKTPSGINKVSAGKNRITVSWEASTGGKGAISYNVYLNESFIENISATSYTFTGLNPETGYIIGIEAVDAEGTKSEIASAQFNTNSATRYEAEDAAFSGGGESPPVIQDAAEASGGKWVDTREGTIEFTVDVETAGSYDLAIYYNLYDRGTKEQNLSINSVSLGSIFFPATGNTDIVPLPSPIKIKLNAGENKITISKNWGWVIIDYIELTEHINVKFDLRYNPVNPAATAEAKKLYTFLLDNYQKKIISGVMTGENISGKTSINDTGLQELNNVNTYSHSNTAYRSITALIGLDYRDATGSSPNVNWKNAVTNLAIDTWNKGGIPAICWHWRNPLHGANGSRNGFYSGSSSGSDYTTFDLRKAFTDNTYDAWDTDTDEYKGLIADMDDIIVELKKLQDAGIAILWRPLHEASGGWFWWGRDREGKPCVQLYRLMYDYMVKENGLNNIIWVWNSDANDDSWYPGDEYVDIIGRDSYAKDHGSLSALFEGTKSWSQAKKIITLSENGPVPFPANLKADEAYWSYFMTWNGQYVSNAGSSGDTYYGNGQANWRTVMTDPYTIRLTAAATEPPLPGMPGWSVYAKTALATPALSGNSTDNSITVAWPEAAGGVTDENTATGYYVYIDGIRAAKLDASGAPAYTIGGLSAETEYTIEVEAYDEDALTVRRSDKGSITISTTIEPEPTTPTKLTAGEVTTNSIALSWTASTGGAGTITYSISANGEPVESGITGTSYVLTGLEPGTTYNIELVAVDGKDRKSDAATIKITVPFKEGNIKVISEPLKTYGDADYILTADHSGGNTVLAENLHPDIISLIKTKDGYTVHILKAGIATLKFSSTQANGYDAAVAEFTITVKKAELSIYPENVSRPYGTENPVLSFSTSGLQYFDSVDDLGKITLTTDADINSLPGIYTITAAGTLSDDNYIINYHTGELIIEKLPTILTLPDEIILGTHLYTDETTNVIYTSIGNLLSFKIISNNENAMYVLSGDERIAVITENDNILVTGFGLVKITVYQAGSEIYEPLEAVIWLLFKDENVTGINVPVQGNSKVAVYPNPAPQFSPFYVSADIDEALLKDAVIEIYNVLGTLVKTVQVAGKRTVVDSPGAQGTYCLVLKTKSGFIKSLKVIVK